MRVLLLSTLALVFRSGSSAEKTSECITPDSQNGTCVAINLCQEIITLLQEKNSTLTEFIKNSQCGFDKVAYVCCKSPKIDDYADLYDKYFTTVKPKVPVVYYKIKGLPDRSVCGLVKATNKIFFGQITDLGEFPWAAALVYNDTAGLNAGVKCGGSLINTRFVLTAAHCLLTTHLRLNLVLLGEWNVTSNPDCVNGECADNVLKIPVGEEIPHPFYSDRFHNNDIGVIRLKYEINFSDFVRPICLPPVDLPNPKVGDIMTAIGWGQTEDDDKQSDVLLKVDLPLISNSDCLASYNGDVRITTNKLCAGGDNASDTCQGDSGGPLLRTYLDVNSLQWYQEGVVSVGQACGKEIPAVYTRVTKYVNWIIRKLTDQYD